MSTAGALVTDDRGNAALAWAAVALSLPLAALALRDGQLLRPVFVVATAAAVLVPAAARGTARWTPPWEAVALAVVPAGAWAVGLPVPGVADRAVAYVAVVALAFLLVVELHVWTPVRMPVWFAAAFVVLCAMTAGGAWTVLRFLSDSYLGTDLLGSRVALMWDLVGATAGSLLAGPAFGAYFRRREGDG